MAYEKEDKIVKDLPYTLVSNTCLIPSFGITLKAGGLKELIKDCHKEDLIHITIHQERATEFRISKYIKD